MASYFEAVTRVVIHLGAPTGLLVLAFFIGLVVINGIIAALTIAAEPDRPWRSRIERVIWPLFLALFGFANAAEASHADLGALWLPLSAAAGGGAVLRLAGPGVARVLMLPRLAQAAAAMVTPVPAALAWLLRPVLARVILPVANRLQPHLSAFRVAMIAVLSLCAGLVGMVALSFVRG